MVHAGLSVADRLGEVRRSRGWSLRQLAREVPCSATHVHDIERGRKEASPQMLVRLDEVLGAGGALATSVRSRPSVTHEEEAQPLAERVDASDVGTETLDRLASAVDDLATAYATTQPAELLPLVRQHLAYVARLVEVRKTLFQQRRLLVLGGWLSLLAATVHIDQRQPAAAAARLATAERLAVHAGHSEIEAWCWETRAWEVLTVGDYPQAVELSQRAQAMAPGGSSALIQATALPGQPRRARRFHVGTGA